MSGKTRVNSWPAGAPKKLIRMGQSIIEVFEAHARFNPSRTAVVFYGRDISYGELDYLSNNLGTSLIKMGIRRGDRISVYMENCPQFIITMLAGWKIGAVMVPSNPMFLGEELVYQLTDAGAETIILQDDLFPVFETIRKRTPVTNVIVTGRTEFLPERPTLPLHHTLLTSPAEVTNSSYLFSELVMGSGERPGGGPELEDLALLQYTAGTTGLPKGAMVTHSSLLFNTAGSSAWYDGHSGDIHLAVLPLFEVTGLVHSMSSPFYTGGTIILLARYDTETVLEAVERYHCTHWASIATMNIALINYPWVNKWNLSSLRFCHSGGSPVHPEVIRVFRELTGTILVEGYGLTETISQVTLNPIDNPIPGSVGIPVYETEIKIVDINDWNKELPLGTEGELLVKGPQVMKGYWNRPGETRQALHDGWLATGDMARVDRNGFVYIVGRKRELIKPSGFLIFPREVENFLYQHPAVAEVVVVGIPDPYRIETVKAYIVLRKEYVGKITEQELIDWSKGKMAAYKYPRVIEFVNELPHSGTGQVNRFFISDWEARKVN